MVGHLTGRESSSGPGGERPQDAAAQQRAQPPPRLSVLSSALWRLLSGSAVALAWIARRWASAARPEAARDLGERLASPPPPADWPKGGLWLHAASLGEVQALAPLARALAGTTTLPLCVTTSTVSGRQRAAGLLGLPSRLAPLDSPGPLRRFLDHTAPRGHIIVETELWPRRLSALADRGVPVALVSGRLSPARWPRYLRYRDFYRPMLGKLTLVCPAAPADGDRFVRLGLDPGKLGPVGNLKWDSAPGAASAAEAKDAYAALGLDPERPWVVLGSVHPGEAGCLVRVLSMSPGLPEGWGVLVVPRHPARFGEVAAELERAGVPAHRASAGPAPPAATTVLVDRLGVLSRLYLPARAAFLGGTLISLGGHSPLEAAAAGCPLAAGPHIHQQADLCEPLGEAGALVQGSSAAEVGSTLAFWLQDPSAARRAGEAGRQCVESRRGHAERLAALLGSWLP